MSDDNKWSQPEQPPPPLFLGQKEKDLVKQVNDELLERVIGQQIAYYPIDLETTHFHPIYGEARVKNFLPPIQVYALVEWNKSTSAFKSNVGIDRENQITVHFHRRRLVEDKDMFVRVGDFVQYEKELYEIMTSAEPKQLFGQVGNPVEISCVCVRTRRGIFNAQ